jgi:hypothetical protein
MSDSIASSLQNILSAETTDNIRQELRDVEQNRVNSLLFVSFLFMTVRKVTLRKLI